MGDKTGTKKSDKTPEEVWRRQVLEELRGLRTSQEETAAALQFFKEAAIRGAVYGLLLMVLAVGLNWLLATYAA